MLKTLHFSVLVNAPRDRVWKNMLDQEAYKKWTSIFTEGSYYEGSWNKGDKVRFLSPKGSGMIAEIAESRENEFLSIRHLGFIIDGVEDTTSAEVKAWAPAYENYSFTEKNGKTEVKVDIQVTADFEKYMTKTWPLALDKLREMSE